MTALQAMDPEAQRPKIEVVEAQQPNLARAQPVAAGDQEQRAITRAAPHDGEQPGELAEGEGTGSFRWASGPSPQDRMPRNCPK